MSEQPEARKAKRTGRSPNYPGIDLPTAIERARVVFDKENRHEAPMATITAHWGYSAPTNGGAATTYSALKKFGLLEDVGSGADRRGKLTDLAFEILRSPDPSDAIRVAALTPEIHDEMWQKYGASLPSDRNLQWTLVRERGFTESGAEDFIREYRSTVAFAGLNDEQPEDPVQVDVASSPNTLGRRDQVGEGSATPGSLENVASAPQAAASGTRIPIPLVGGQMIIIEGHFPITSSAWENFRSVLDAFRPGLVLDAAPAQPSTARDLGDGATRGNSSPASIEDDE